MIYRLEETQAELRGAEHFIAPGAVLIGRVILEARASVWFNAVLRGDVEPLHIGEESNVQDFAMLHADPGFPLQIGPRVTIGHHAVVHGCTVDEACLIGINAVILNGARLGRHCLVGANAMVPEGMEVPEGSLVVGTPARVRRSLSSEERTILEASAQNYVQNAQRFLRGLKPA